MNTAIYTNNFTQIEVNSIKFNLLKLDNIHDIILVLSKTIVNSCPQHIHTNKFMVHSQYSVNIIACTMIVEKKKKKNFFFRIY